MTRFVSRISSRYIRSLVYMMQASEYNIRDFFSWYRRVQDFRVVEYRKSIVWTLKARALLVFSWSLVALVASLGIVSVNTLPPLYAWPLVIVFGHVVTYFLPYALAGAVFLGQSIQKPVESVRVKRARRILAKHQGLKIAIAGSFGKTTMREILKSVLSAGKKVAAPPGSYNTPLGIASFVETLIGDEEVILFELGEYYPGDIRKLCEFVGPSIGIITGVNEAHLEKFGTLDKTTATVFELADYLKGRTVYVSGDNNVAREHAAPDHILFSSIGVGDWTIENPRTGLDGTSFTVGAPEGNIHAESKLLGLHMIGPITAAAHIAKHIGLSVSEIEKGITATRPFEHRLEPKHWGDGVLMLDDSYNGNPDGVRAVITFLASLSGRRFYVTPGLVEMGASKEVVHKEIGRQLAMARIDQVILIRNSVTPYIEEGLKAAGFTGILTWFTDGPKAYAALRNMTVPGDVVLIQNDWPDQYA